MDIWVDILQTGGRYIAGWRSIYRRLEDVTNDYLTEPITRNQLLHIEGHTFFEDMMKCVADVDKGLLAVNADLHADLEALLLENGSEQRFLYGFNIIYDDWEIEFDSLINPPRNRDAGYPRAGRTVADPAARKRIEEIVEQWIQK